MLRRFNLDPTEVIHIGDSIISDVSGAQNAGIRAIWLNRLNKTKPEGITPDYICKDLFEVRECFEQFITRISKAVFVKIVVFKKIVLKMVK
ncbi:hypothetical protein GCM10010916_37100 [Paenibacillus abyssi]|uniref:HAD family hydrolase n=1 Tax=Paenibacillus abyssi TaxID=1340531 RepID=A0A917G0T8_9BACL|nr:hypothetical protein GCM10010916_37100 [Paenibacillus abyssi]